MVKVQRIGVFAFGDEKGIVDDYILFLLEDMMKIVQKLVVVLYTKISDEQKQKLQKFTEHIFFYENAECDIDAWGYYFLHDYKKNECEQYNDLILFNDCFFGPFDSFVPMFSKMEEKKYHFWGISSCRESLRIGDAGEELVIPFHINSYFTAYSREIFQDKAFVELWSKILMEDTKDRRINKHAEIFTSELQRFGYSCGTYIEDQESEIPKEYAVSLDIFSPDYMIINKKSPIMLKKIFEMKYEEWLHLTGGEPLVKCMEYIEKQTNYDVNLIWTSILRSCNITDIKQKLHLNYVLPTQKYVGYHNCDKKVAVIIHNYYIDLVDEIVYYAKQVPEYIDLYITTNTVQKKQIIEAHLQKETGRAFSVLLTENRGRDLASLLVTCRKIVLQYDYVCFTHDKKTTGNAGPVTVGKSFFFTAIDNMLSSTAYIANIVDLFEKNARLGVLASPAPLHNVYFGAIGREWTVCYDETIKILEQFGVNVIVSPEKQPFVLGTSLWFRTEALSKLFEKEWTHEEFPEEPLGGDGTMSHGLERSFPYFAQDKGYFSGWVMTSEYASLEISNLNFLMTNGIGVHQKKKEPYVDFFLKDYLEIHKANRTEKAVFYFDMGEGYSENYTCNKIYEIATDGSFEICLAIPERFQKNLKALRFDPIEGAGCMLKNLQVWVDEKKILSEKDNGIELEKDVQLFFSHDPWIAYSMESNQIERVRISGNISRLDDMTASGIWKLLKGKYSCIIIWAKYIIKKIRGRIIKENRKL